MKIFDNNSTVWLQIFMHFTLIIRMQYVQSIQNTSAFYNVRQVKQFPAKFPRSELYFA